MSAYDPNFELDLSTDLWREASSPDALRAGLLLPTQIRFHGARQALFVAAGTTAAEADAKDSARTGLDRATEGFRAIRDLLAHWRDRRDLNPVLLTLFERARSDQPDTVAALDRYRDMVADARAAIFDRDEVSHEVFNRVMVVAYAVFHPAMLDLSGRMAEAGREIHAGSARSAQDARTRALDARQRIESIARTVRLISLNARVEAARAGEAGRAFGVIAREIEALSEQTGAVSAEMGQSVDEMMEMLRMT